MEKAHLKTLAQFSKAFWGDPNQFRPKVLDTVSALSLLEEDPDIGLEKGAMALLARVKREGNLANTQLNASFIQSPFYRLDPEERFILVALHSGRWGYPVLCRVLEKDPLELQEFAWKTRQRLAALANNQAGTVIPYPSAPSNTKVTCPEFQMERPWAQRFLDDAIESGSDRMYLQNHLMACDLCRSHLNRCREFYHRIEALIPTLSDQDEVLPLLSKAVRQSELMRDPMKTTFADSLVALSRRPDVWIALAVTLYFLKQIRF